MAFSITSAQNPTYKFIKSLFKRKGRKAGELFIAEGAQEIDIAIGRGYIPEFVCFSEVYTDKEQVDVLSRKAGNQTKFLSLSKSLFEAIAYQHIPGNIVGVFKPKNLRMEEIIFPASPIVIVLEYLEKPGNLGAILRTAEAVGVDAVLLVGAKFDLYNPNVIRNSRGAIFSIPVVECSNEVALSYLKQLKCNILVAELGASEPYFGMDFQMPTSVVFGSESKGVSEYWKGHSDRNIIIPMEGTGDSLNVSVSAAVVLYEAYRQRKFLKPPHNT